MSTPLTPPPVLEDRQLATWTAGAIHPAVRAIRNLLLAVCWRPLLALLAPVTAVGVDALATGGCVVATNHASHADTIVLQAALHRAGRRKVVAAAACDYWFTSGVRRGIGAVLGGAVPMPRRGEAGLDVIRGLVAEGWTVLLYPQGSRKASAQRWRRGVGVLAAQGVPVVVGRLEGTSKLLPPRRWLPIPTPTSVAFGRVRPLRGADPGVTAVALQHRAEGLVVRAVRPSPVQRVSARLTRAAGSWGWALVACWAFAEASVWPLIPDLLLAGMAFAAPWAARRLWAAAVSATTLGGVVFGALAATGASWPLPMVSNRMAAHALDGLVDRGPAGLLGQPLSGVPYKAWVAATGQVPVDLAEWAWWTFAARGARMAAVTVLAAGAGWLLRRWLPRAWWPPIHLLVVVAGAICFWLGLSAVQAAWQ